MRVLGALIVLAISMASVNAIAARSGQATESASLSGTAADASGRALSNSTVQLRNVSTGKLVGSSMTDAAGQFSFPNLPPGTYVVEVLNAAGQIAGTSAALAVSAGWAMTGVSVTTVATPSAAAGSGHLMSTHAMIILGAAAAAGVAGGIAMASGGTASPSQ